MRSLSFFLVYLCTIVFLFGFFSPAFAIPLYELLPNHTTISGEKINTLQSPHVPLPLPQNESLLESVDNSTPTSLPPLSSKEIDRYRKFYEKGLRRAEVLETKNNRLSSSLSLAEPLDCIRNTTFENFQNFGVTEKSAFDFWISYCSFEDFLAQVEAREQEERKQDLINTITYHIGVHIPEELINRVLNKKYWDSSTNTLLGNEQGFVHSIVDQNFSELQDIGVTQLIGVGVSNYVGSDRNRKMNVRNAANKLDGKILHPGQTLSVGAMLSPFTYENGYTDGIVIKEGENEQEMGGGVCQSVTTIFRAWQNSGLEVSFSKPHSKSIGYYGGIGLDATIYYPSVDLLLKNNTRNSILIKVVDRDPYQVVFLYGTKDRRVILERYKFSQWEDGQEANWRRLINYDNTGEWVENYFTQSQKR